MSEITVRTDDIRAAAKALEEAQAEYVKKYLAVVDICAKGARLCGSDDGAAAFLMLGRGSGWPEMVTDRGDTLQKGADLLVGLMSGPESICDFLKAAPEGGVQ